jgi:hypothetical protein
MPATNTSRTNALKTILWLGLLTGTLDAIAAILLSLNVGPIIIFKFIASGFFGKPAFAGGSEMVAAGVIFHYLIAYAFTLFFYLLYPFAYRLFKNKYAVAIIYGGFAWIIMNMVVMPFTKIGAHHIKPTTIITGVLALTICVALPVVLVADKRLLKK